MKSELRAPPASPEEVYEIFVKLLLAKLDFDEFYDVLWTLYKFLFIKRL